MKINKKKFIYLISPNRISKNFLRDLTSILKTNRVGIFQMRLKKYSLRQKLLIGKKIKNICVSNKVCFLVNDDPWLAKKLDADGCHLGQNDMNIKEAREIIGNKIIGITCHNSIKLAKIAIKSNANYLAFGAFNKTKTKKIKYQATTKILQRIHRISNIPVVAIGGINSNNYKNLLLNKANFLAISSYIWNNKKLKPKQAMRILK